MRIRALVVALPLVVLVACGSSSTSSSTPSSATSASTTGSSSAGSSTSTSAAATLGPTVPADTAVAAALPAAQLPTATGKFGVKPVVTVPKSNPPASLQRIILTQGTGPAVVKTDYLVTNYLGQIWGGKVFDNSYDRKATSTFQIGTGAVVPGWDVALVGLKVGSRVMLVLPPSDGYGSAGSPSAGIKGTDTLVFVIDIVKSITPGTPGQANAVKQTLPKGLPTVTGALGKDPTVKIPKGLAEPKKNAVYVIAKGTGPKVVAGSVLAQLVVSDWAQTQTQSTWKKTTDATTGATTFGLQEIPVAAGGSLAGLIGLPLGSRVLVLLAPVAATASAQASDGAAAVVDVVAQG